MIGALLKKSMPHLFAERYTFTHDEALHLLEARRGRGKSYTLTWFVWQAVAMRRPVWMNFTVDLYRLALQAKMRGLFPTVDEAMAWVSENVRLLRTWDDLLVTFDGFVLLDEAARIFDSRHRSRIPQVVLEWSQLSRRSRVTIFLASQSFDWLDVRLRQLADTLWMVRKIQGKPRKDGTRPLPRSFIAYGLDPWAKGLSESVIRDHADRKMEIPFSLRIAQLYDTREPIEVLDGEPRWSTYADVFAHLVDEGRIPEAVAHRIRTRLFGLDGRVMQPALAVPS